MTLTHSEQFAASWADGRNAVHEAVVAAVEALGGARPRLVLFFADATLPPDEVVNQSVAGANGARLAGMSAVGMVTAGGLRQGGCSAMAFGGEDVAVGVGVAQSASLDLSAAGSDATAAASPASSFPRVAPWSCSSWIRGQAMKDRRSVVRTGSPEAASRLRAGAPTG